MPDTDTKLTRPVAPSGDEDLIQWLTGRRVPSLPCTLGERRVRSLPCLIPSRRMKALNAAALAVCTAYDELCLILARDPSHLDTFFGLTPLEKMLWYSSGSLWHGISRADVFCTADGGIAVAEINSDTPSGADEAYLLGRYAAARASGFLNPSAALPAAFLAVVRDAYNRLVTPSPAPTVGVVYPTDIPEDQGMIELYRQWLEQDGFRVLLGSPSNLEMTERGGTALFGTEIDVLLRHYKTDWWCERTNVWKDARRILDSAPLLRELRAVVEPMARGMLAVVNPFGAVVTQNKLSLAFFHERIDLFSPVSQEAILRYVPPTRRLTSFTAGVLNREKDDWVLKSDYGCEGAEVIVGRLTGREAWTNALRLAVPAHWVAQRYFESERQDGGVTENYGVYIVGGRPAGLYVRLSRGVTGSTAVVAPALERPPLAGRGATPAPLHEDPPATGTRVRDLISAYTPSERWLRFRMKLLLHSAEDARLIGRYQGTRNARECEAAGASLAALIGQAGEDARGSLLVVSDLAGPDSAAFAAGASAGAEVVLQIENIAHERESVPLRRTLGALEHFAPTVGSNHARHGADRVRPAVILLDRMRISPVSDGIGQFNNRHWAYLPAIKTLEDLGIRSILYIAPDAGAAECDDLNEDFVQYHDSGIRICYAAPGLLHPARYRNLETLLSATGRPPLRRETIFSYMLPPEGAPRYAYNQEGTPT